MLDTLTSLEGWEHKVAKQFFTDVFNGLGIWAEGFSFHVLNLAITDEVDVNTLQLVFQLTSKLEALLAEWQADG